MIDEVKKVFAEKFGAEGDIRFYFAPGRVNLIGEHTDYNGGHVFPCALTIGTYVVARKRDDDLMRFYSMNFEESGLLTATLTDLVPLIDKRWISYPKGMVWSLEKEGYKVNSGFDMVVYGNIPNGSGLSSSASLEMATGVMLKDMFGFADLTMTKLALIGQYCENHFNGVNSGIMDQFAVAMGKKDTAIFLDTADLSYDYVPIRLAGMKIVIISSNKKRGLADSKYNERRQECETALDEIRQVRETKSLGNLSIEEFEAVKDAIKDPVRQRRAKHAVYENQRTIQAVETLKKGDIETFGKLMNASHVSLRDDYEVTGIELDTLAEEAWKCEGVIGSRMTGAGFGGCTVSIVKEEAIDEFIKKVGTAYEEKIGYAADFYVVSVGDGAGILD